jgi:retron-type reverse transcriptase
MDLRVNHDILMGLVAKRVADKRLLKLIRGFLTAGVLEGGLVSPTEEGTPQGGPLSPLLSNLMLDVLDKELEKRGHRFVRYADDCNIYVFAAARQVSVCWPASRSSLKGASSSRSTRPRARLPGRAPASS